MVAVCAAASFVIMMFNLPLPGGTTGHAVGMGLVAILLGPWASILAISVALFIQAVFFGDGGITAFGANCLNMAVAGSLVAHAVYRAVSGRAPLASPRRAIAAGLAGYAGINAAALLASIEFGLQPLLFHDAAGAPLYAPYPLSIAVPAMMLGHLTFAGLAEAFLAAGGVAWMQHSDPVLWQSHAPEPVPAAPGGWRLARPLGIALALLALATPLGLLAGGTAWGEWSAEDFSRPETREAIAGASLHAAPPEKAPHGLARLAELWKAPLPDYAPPFLRSAVFGYLFCAALGIGLTLAASLLLHRALRPKTAPAAHAAPRLP
jgi:cobalt/nickel transport system permease protein